MFKRHDLVWVNNIGRKDALQYFRDNNPHNLNESAAEELILNERIPAIVKRQENDNPDYLEIGFSSCYYFNGRRFRISSRIPKNSIVDIKTPFLVLEFAKNSKAIQQYPIIHDIILSGNRNNIELGIYGSTAMQMVTGLPYINENSDIDIYARKKNSSSDLSSFYGDICMLEEKHNVIIDIEVEIMDVFGVKLKEIFSQQKTVLAKGFRSVEIFRKSELNELD